MDEQSPTLADFARHSPIPGKVLLYLHRQHLIRDPPSRDDLLGLRLLEQIWGNKEILRSQLSRMSKKSRLQFLLTAHLDSKWERYAYSRFFNREPGTRLRLETVIEEIESTFLFRLSQREISRLRTISVRARVARYRAQKQKKDSVPIRYTAQTNKE